MKMKQHVIISQHKKSDYIRKGHFKNTNNNSFIVNVSLILFFFLYSLLLKCRGKQFHSIAPYTKNLAAGRSEKYNGSGQSGTVCVFLFFFFMGGCEIER